MSTEEVPVLVLGGGVSGLAAAAALGPRAVVLERAERPGGLVRTTRRGDYWFDKVLHLLYCPDEPTRERVGRLLGDDLAICPPQAFVETAAGTTRFPFQMNLRGLEPDAVARCLRDLAEVTWGPQRTPQSFEEMLLHTFGRAMCDLFLLPYNRKMWKRPLADLAPSGFQWNIARPEFTAVVRGALEPDPGFEPYNARGTYPRPPAGAPVRGMEVLTVRLAEQVADLRVRHEVVGIDPEARTVTCATPDGPRTLRWTERLVSTLPLPVAVRLCTSAPPALRDAVASLPVNRVYTAMISVRGPRPEGTGLWRYYADPELIFTRLIWMHAFDPLTAPPDGWGLMAEITWPAEDPPESEADLLQRAVADARRAGAIGAGCEVVDTHLERVEPAYVVFTPRSRRTVDDAAAFLREAGIEPLGRYGRWEYSSMGQVMRDGFALGDALREEIGS